MYPVDRLDPSRIIIEHQQANVELLERVSDGREQVFGPGWREVGEKLLLMNACAMRCGVRHGLGVRWARSDTVCSRLMRGAQR